MKTLELLNHVERTFVLSQTFIQHPTPTFEKPYGKVQGILKKGWASLAVCHYKLRHCRVMKEVKSIATLRLDYGYEFEYEYEFSNQIRVPHHTNLIPDVYLCVCQQQENDIVWGCQLRCLEIPNSYDTRSRTRSQI